MLTYHTCVSEAKCGYFRILEPKWQEFATELGYYRETAPPTSNVTTYYIASLEVTFHSACNTSL